MRMAILLAAAAALGACGSDDEVEMKNASVADVSKEMSKTDTKFVEPGKWQQTATLVAIEAPGMPAQVKDAVQRNIGQSQVHEVCLTPDKAKNPREDFWGGADKNCKYEHFNWGGGKVDLKMLCTHPQATQTMELAGTYEPDSYQMAMSVTSKGSTPMESMTMKMRVDAKRVGDCDKSQG